MRGKTPESEHGPGRSADGDPSRRTAILILVSFAMMIVSLDQYIVVVALPEIGRDLKYSPQTLQAVVSAYAIASSGFLLLGGRASDLLGRRRVLLLGLLLYAGGSLTGGLASAPVWQLAARAIQGLGGALVFPSTLALINVLFAEGPARNRAVSIWAGAGAAGLVIGVLLGGVLTSALGWRSVFLINVPLAGIAIVASLVLIHRDASIDRALVRLSWRLVDNRRRHADRAGARPGAGTWLDISAHGREPDRGGVARRRLYACRAAQDRPAGPFFDAA